MIKNPDYVSQLPKGWESTTVGDSFHVIGGGTPSTEKREYWEGKIPWISSADISGENSITPRRYITQDAIKNSATSLIPSGSIIVVTRVGLGKVALTNFPLCISQDSQALIPQNHKIDTKFALYLLSQAAKSFEYQGRGTTVSGITKKELKELLLPVPPISEQYRISQILSTWDRAIERVQRLIEAKQRQKAKLVSQLLSGQIRFSGFQDEWEQVKLGTFLHPKFRKVVKPAGAYLRLGIRSHGKGTFTSVVDDPETIALTHLFQARKDDLIVNITFAWEGAIALVGPDGDGALVSHRFPTYVFDTSKMLPEYFKHLMVTERFFYELDLISPGGAGRNRVMNKGDFLKITVAVPDIEEQKKIAVVLGGMDEQIALLRKYLEKLKEQKKGLMQKLLTGEIRVKVD